MGFIYYNGVTEYEFEDRTLAHLKSAIGAKLRRQECFFLNWSNPAEAGSGRVTLWIAPSIPLIFRFSGNTPPTLNPEWVQVLVETANTPRGMTVIKEDNVAAALEALSVPHEALVGGTNG
ncbi:DUF7882 family protein [Leucobacter aridicollis]|uniref:DUF7882 family protein n=1 Tax=Leucobacter aridicollis TaxID=283878 RepID=UPI0021075385|nr:hypothetical protein [Leucobacter aridicollis]